MFLTFSQIFSASKQIYYQIQQNPDSSKPKFSIPNKKKFIKLEINPKSENNKIRTTHATTTTTRKSEIKESKQIGDSAGRSRVWRMVRRFLGSQRSVANGFDDFWVFWVRDDWWWMGLTISGFAIWGMGLTARSLSLSLSVFMRLSPSFSRSLSLFGHYSTNELGLGFSRFVRALGCGLISPSPVLGCWCDLSSLLSLSLFYFPGAEVIWSENKNGNYFPPSQPYFTVKLKTFLVWLNFQ